MSFHELLNTYMKQGGISASQLSQASGLSQATISRFRSGKREPRSDTDTIEKLSDALSQLSSGQLAKDQVAQALTGSLKNPHIDHQILALRLNQLIDILKLNVIDMSRFLNFDPSYLSRIRSGQRHPASSRQFLNQTARFALQHAAPEGLELLEKLMECPGFASRKEEEQISLIVSWLSTGPKRPSSEEALHSFLNRLDRFDLREYLPSASPLLDLSFQTSSHLPEFQFFSGVEGFKQSELLWLQATVQSPSSDPVILYSDMPIHEMRQDKQFYGQYLLGMNALLKKGLQLNVIHQLDRSFDEMLIGLESFIPLYMTGQVVPWYLRGMNDSYFHHCLRASTGAVLTGEAIHGHFPEGRFLFSTQKEQTDYGMRRALALLEKAEPLMEIYSLKQAGSFDGFIRESLQAPHQQFLGLAQTPSWFVMEESLLQEILNANALEESTRNTILQQHQQMRAGILEQLETSQIQDSFCSMDREEFAARPAQLIIPELFLEQDIHYTYEQYQKHLEQAREFSTRHPSYQLHISTEPEYQNIQIRIMKGKWALISRTRAPAILFLIRHPQLLRAIEEMVIHRYFNSSFKAGAKSSL